MQKDFNCLFDFGVMIFGGCWKLVYAEIVLFSHMPIGH